MLINYKKIGDTLTDSELNAYVSLIAHNKVLKDSFKLKNGVITGNYGEYTFDLSNASIVDNGILITDETLSNNITVKLSNATQYATYTLHFSVVRYGDVNILDETTDNIETFDLSVDLITDTTINIPLDTLQEYDVILFNSNITIQHNRPQIIGNFVTGLNLTLSPVKITTGQTSTITINATDLQTLPVPNKAIKLYKDGTLLDTLTTDTNGQCTKTITGTGAGLTGLQAQYHSVTSPTEYLKDLYYWFVGNESFSTKFVFSNSLTTTTEDDYLKIVNATAQTRYATLSNDGSTNLSFATTDSFTLEYDQYISTTYFRSSVCGQNCQPTLTADTWYHIRVEKHETTIKWYIDDELQCTQTQTANGVISLAIGANSTSKIKNIELLMGVPNTKEITLTADQSIIESGSTSTITATLTDSGTALTGETVTFTAKQGSTILDTTTKTTDSNGECTYSYTGSGLGDIMIIAQHEIISSGTNIEDCWNTKLTEFSVGSNTINSIGMDTVHNVQNDDFVLVFEHKGNGTLSIGATSQYSSSNANYRATLGSYDSKHYCAIRTTSTSEVSATSMDLNTYYTYKIERIGTTINFYVDDVLWETKTASFFTDYNAYSIYSIKWGGGTDYFKNIRLKPYGGT